MDEKDRMTRMLDEHEVRAVRARWAFSRDQGDWDTLAGCFHPDAQVTVSWYTGSAAGLIERSKEMAAAQKPEERTKHWLGNWQARARGDRAILETDAQVQTRNFIDGVLYDCVSFQRFYDQLERREGVWRIAKWSIFIDKDTLAPTVPGTAPPGFWDGVELTGDKTGFAFMRHRQKRVGRTTLANLVYGNSAEERALRREAEAWLGAD